MQITIFLNMLNLWFAAINCRAKNGKNDEKTTEENIRQKQQAAAKPLNRSWPEIGTCYQFSQGSKMHSDAVMALDRTRAVNQISAPLQHEARCECCNEKQFDSVSQSDVLIQLWIAWERPQIKPLSRFQFLFLAKTFPSYDITSSTIPVGGTWTWLT